MFPQCQFPLPIQFLFSSSLNYFVFSSIQTDLGIALVEHSSVYQFTFINLAIILIIIIPFIEPSIAGFFTSYHLVLGPLLESTLKFSSHRPETFPQLGTSLSEMEDLLQKGTLNKWEMKQVEAVRYYVEG